MKKHIESPIQKDKKHKQKRFFIGLFTLAFALIFVIAFQLFVVRPYFLSAQTLQEIRFTPKSVVGDCESGTLTFGQDGLLHFCQDSSWKQVAIGEIDVGVDEISAAQVTPGTFGSVSTLGNYLFRNTADTQDWAIFDATNMRVGIGVTNPSEKLEVDGNIKLAGGTPTHRITNVAGPIAGSDASTKDYVDAQLGGQFVALYGVAVDDGNLGGLSGADAICAGSEHAALCDEPPLAFLCAAGVSLWDRFHEADIPFTASWHWANYNTGRTIPALASLYDGMESFRGAAWYLQPDMGSYFFSGCSNSHPGYYTGIDYHCNSWTSSGDGSITYGSAFCPSDPTSTRCPKWFVRKQVYRWWRCANDHSSTVFYLACFCKFTP